MRNVLLTLSIALLPVLGFSQATFLTQSGTADTVSGSYTSGDLEVHNRLKSASTNNVTVTWKVVDKGLGTNWQISGFCDNNLCYYNDTNTNSLIGAVNNSLPITNANFNTPANEFHILFYAASAPNGTSSWARVNVKDKDGTYERNLTFIGRKGVTGLYSVSTSSEDIVLYPNPARDAINVIYDDKAGVKTIAVYNLIGKLMGPIYKPASNSSAKIDLDNMPNGMYFLRLMDGQGRVLATRRFTRQ